MADGSIPDRIAPEVMHEVIQAAEKAAESALESGDVESIKEEVSTEGQRALHEIQDFAKIAEDPEDPSLMEDVNQKVSTVQAEIQAAVEAAKAEVERAVRGEAPASPEAQIAELKKTNVTEATGETATVARTEAAPVPSPDSASPTPEKAEVPMEDFVNRLKDIATEFKSSDKTASKLLQKKLLKLMGDANPDRYPNDVRVAEIRSMMGRLKMAFDGDASAWENPRGGTSYEQDLAMFGSSLNGEAAKEPAAETSADGADDAGAAQTEAPKKEWPAKPARVETPPPHVGEEMPAVNFDELYTHANLAYQTGNEESLAKSVADIEAGTAAHVGGLQKKIEDLQKLSPDKRGPAHSRELERLQLEVSLAEKKMEWQKAQLELMKARRELVSVTVDIDKTKRELEARSSAQDMNLLSANAEEGRVLAIPGEDPKVSLQKKLDELTTKRDDLLKKIGGLESSVNALASEIEKLGALLKRAQADEQRAGAQKEKKLDNMNTSGPDEHEGKDTMPSAQAPAKGSFDFEKDVIDRAGNYIHDPSEAAVDIIDLVSMKSKPGAKKDE